MMTNGGTETLVSLKMLPNEKFRSIETLNKIVDASEIATDDESVRIREQSILELGELLCKAGRAQELASLIQRIRPFLNRISRAKAAKLVRQLVDLFLDMEACTGLEVEICQEVIEWAKEEKRTFLRQSLECRLIALLIEIKRYEEALQLNSKLLKELKKLDDKNLLVEVLLLESKTYHALSNLPKARAALTSARTTANAIYCPPKMQAALELQSGILHAADERDFKTAFSYFYEAFEGYDSIDSPKASTALKYMLLSKIMLKQPEDVKSLATSKLALKYAGPNIEAMLAIAKASSDRSLSSFKEALSKFEHELCDDPIIRSHFDTLYDNMLEQNLSRIIEPYSRVQVDRIAKIICLDKDIVEKKLSQMILDKKISGILDQGVGVLIIFDESEADQTYDACLETIQNMNKVVDSLYQRAKKLS